MAITGNIARIAGMTPWMPALGLISVVFLSGCDSLCPKADFSVRPESGEAPLQVEFINMSRPGMLLVPRYLWDFGDGSPLVAETSPTHTYTEPGQYTVILTVQSLWCRDVYRKMEAVNVVRRESDVLVDFSASPSEGPAPLTVTFLDKSVLNNTVVSEWFWKFGDGYSSSLREPRHTYANAGVYDVTLTVSTDRGRFEGVIPNAVKVFVGDGEGESVTEGELDVRCPEDLSVCADMPPFTFAGMSPAGGVYNGPGISGNRFSPSEAGRGTHVITYTYTMPDRPNYSGSCAFRITVFDPETICPEDLSVCTDAPPVTLSGGWPAGGMYSGPGVLKGQFNPAVVSAGTYVLSYTYAVPESPECTHSCLFTVTVMNPGPECPEDVSVCRDAGPFTLTGALAAGGIYSGPGVSEGRFDPAAAGVGVHRITYTYTLPGIPDCTGACVFTVTVVNSTIICPADLTVCAGSAAFALTGGSPAGGAYSGPGIINGQFNPMVAGVGVHGITYTYSTPYAPACGDKCKFTITVIDPAVTCPADQSVCAGAAAFTLTGASPAGGIYSGPGVSGGQFDPVIAGVGAHEISYTYVISGIPNCADKAAFTITVIDPAVTCPADQSVCAGAAAFTLAGALPAGGVYSGPGVSGGQFDPGIAGIGVHEITYRYEVPGAPDCVDEGAFTITVADPAVTCPADIAVCAGTAAFALTGASPGGGVYSGPGVSEGWFDPIVAGIGVHEITYSYEVPGVPDCWGSCSFMIAVADPAATCPADLAVCAGSTAFALTGAVPEGGIYSGPGVLDGWFDPTIAGIGIHELTYNYEVPGVQDCVGTCFFTITVADPAVTCPADLAVWVDSEPIALTGAVPAGGVYSGPGVSDGWFDPEVAGVGTHGIGYTYEVPGIADCMGTCAFTIQVADPILECPPETIFAQPAALPDTPGYTAAYYSSNEGERPYVWENLYTASSLYLSDILYDVHWWGVEMDEEGLPCDMALTAFIIDIADENYTPIESYRVTAERTPANYFLTVDTRTLPVYSYDATLDTPCVIAPGTLGFISIRSDRSIQPECRFGWMNSDTGDGEIWMDPAEGAEDVPEPIQDNLAFCLTNAGAPQDIRERVAVNLRRSAGNDYMYIPGEEVSIQVRLDLYGAGNLSDLHLTENLPEGWYFEGVADSGAPDVLPAVGALGELEFAWNQIPRFPVEFRYWARPSADSECCLISGRARYNVAGETVFSNEAQTQFRLYRTLLTIDRVTSERFYRAGQTLDITISCGRYGIESPLALGCVETLPEGWWFEGIVDDGGAMPEVVPGENTAGTLEFAWITPPPMPGSFTYRVRAPQEAQGLGRLTGYGIYRFTGVPFETAVVETVLPRL